jgi:glycosyltransferase involved in cell wall biosynthesis
VFHDAIALKLPAISPRKTVARKPAYLRELLEFDGIAATSSASRGMLEEWWDWLGEKRRPAIETIGLGVDPAPTEPSPIPQGVPTVLSVGTIEGRKNHVALLDAAEALWREGLDFELRIVGMVQRETGLEAAARLRELQDLGRPLRHDGALGERAVEQAYRESTFTVYPSVLEGFGLPVIESLSRGRPCICSARGATGESAKGGGCITVDPPDSAGIAAAMRSLISNRSRIEALAAEARTRTFRTWAEYADGLISWMRTL